MGNPRLTRKKLSKLLENGRRDELLTRLDATDPADVADLLEDIDSDERELVFNLLDPETASEVIVEMEPNETEDVVESLTAEKLAGMIREMAPDDAADFFTEIDENERGAVLGLLDEKQRAELRTLLDYDDESAGGIMTPELCAVAAEASVQDAMNAIAATSFDDPISTVFVVDRHRHLVGCQSISELLAKPRDARMGEVAEPDPVFARIDEDQESIANNFRKYDLYVMPVVDERNRLVGRITVDDVMDVFHDEAAEDMAHMAGAPDIEVNEEMPWRVARLRLPWLMITMGAGMVVSLIIQTMTNVIEIKVLAAFVPVIMAMGGNTGMQASAVTIRSIALGDIHMGRLFKTFSKELMVGVMMGMVCGVLASMIVWLNLRYFGGTVEYSLPHLSAVVGISMGSAMTFAALTGTMMPIFLHRLNIDPAVASGPFVTTGNDLSASLIYFLMCFLLLKM